MEKRRSYGERRGETPQMNDCRYEEYLCFKEDLCGYRRKGVLLRLSGTESTPEAIAQTCCIRERGSYMGDYIMDGKGRLREIRFDKVVYR